MNIPQQRHCKSTQFQAPPIQDLQPVCLQPTAKYDLVYVTKGIFELSFKDKCSNVTI